MATGSSSLLPGVQQRHGAAEAVAEIGGGGVNVLMGGGGPEVQGVAVGVALEAVEALLGEVGGEGTAAGPGGAVQGTGATLLGPRVVVGVNSSRARTSARVMSRP